MLTVLNLAILVFLIGMAAIWATYGFFSAFLHMILVIVCGVIALALWEPVSYMLLGRMPAYAHGIGLLAPFVLSIIILRIPLDKFCRFNLHLPRLAHQIGGAACGLATGILALGMLLNGANFLPMAREALGWEPYNVESNDFKPAEEGRLWGFLRVNDMSAGFFEMLSGGSMSPMSGPSLAEARPDLAKRALYYRMPLDTNQFRSARPESVKVTGFYATDASLENLDKIVDRAAIFPYLAIDYKVPEDVAYGKDGTGLIDAILDDWSAGWAPGAKGNPRAMLNIQAVQQAAKTKDLAEAKPFTKDGFIRLVQLTRKKFKKDMREGLKAQMGKGKTLFIVDTLWNNEYAGTYNSDGKLRLSPTQVKLQTLKDGDLTLVAPIGHSVEYSQDSRMRTFTEVLSAPEVAYTSNAPFHLGLAFVVPAGQEPVRLFIRELRFDLTKLEAPEGQDQPINQNLGALAHVMGAPRLPVPRDGEADKIEQERLEKVGVQLADTGAYAEVNPALPMTFAATSVVVEKYEESNPYQLISGEVAKAEGARGGAKNAIRQIYVGPRDRLIRIKIDSRNSKQLYVNFRSKDDDENTIRLLAKGGNNVNAIGFVLHKPGKGQSMRFDIRDQAYEGGLTADELPLVRDNEALYIYFQAPVGAQLTGYQIGSTTFKFKRKEADATLLVEKQ